jgi:hypothetical protein
MTQDLRKLTELRFSQLFFSLFMSTTHNHDQAQSNELDEGDNIHQPPNGASAMTVATNTPSSIPQHVEDHPTNGVGTPGANDTPPPHLISQSAPLDIKPELDIGDEATDTTVVGDGVEGEELESEEDEEDEDGDEEDDDDEPALKYELFSGAFQDLLKKDSASALAVSTRFLVGDATCHVAISADISTQALGSHNGFAHILDLTGQRIKTFKPHAASVIDICFDSTAEFIATASMDGEYLSLNFLSPT